MIQTDQTGYPSIDRPWRKYYTEQEVAEPLPNCTIYDYVKMNNDGYENSVAINYFGTKISYKSLFTQINEVAKSFLALGVKPGDVVTIVTVSCVNSVLCFYALNRIGAVSNYINVLSSEEDITRFIDECDSKYVVSLDLFANKVCKAVNNKNNCKIIVYSMRDYMPFFIGLGFNLKMAKMDKSYKRNPNVITWDKFVKMSDDTELRLAECPNDVCFIGHTGGTTGFPKSVLLTNHSFNAVAWQYVAKIEHNRGEVFLSVMVPFVTYGSIVNIHMPLCLGLEVALIPKFDANEWPNYIKKYNPSHMCAIPAYVAPMVDNAKLQSMDLSAIKTVGMGGEGMNDSLEQKINSFLEGHGSSARILKGYGMTEVCATAAVEYHSARKDGSVGIPFYHNNFMVYDNENKKELTYNEVGEICMQCESTMLAYKDNEEETKQLIRTHDDGSKWIHTGDLGYIDEDGFLFIEGRMKRMIMTINDGVVYKIFPSQTESVLNSEEAVRESCVVAIKKNNDIVLKAVIVLSTDISEEVLINRLGSLCKKELAENQIPYKYEIVKEFPRTGAGKIDYRKLEEL